jgi:hypothetical protein
MDITMRSLIDKHHFRDVTKMVLVYSLREVTKLMQVILKLALDKYFNLHYNKKGMKLARRNYVV